MGTSLDIITAGTVREILNQHPIELYEVIKNSYVLHEQKGCINAPSSFLFFPHRPEARIIGLPAAIKPNQKNFNEVSGIKWISSYPKNKLQDLPRASAVIILNHPDTGFPMACMEGSLISATRTALSAVAGAEYLYSQDKICKSLGIVGTGFIAQHIVQYLFLLGWHIEEIQLYDTIASSVKTFHQYIKSMADLKVTTHNSVTTLVKSSDLIVFATTEKIPYLSDRTLFTHNPCVLHMSLRDIAPEIILESINVVDDIDHILTANTSVHLAYENNQKNASFIKSTIGQLIQNNQYTQETETIIYSPMGLGILDLTVSQFVYDRVEKKDLKNIENFFPS